MKKNVPTSLQVRNPDGTIDAVPGWMFEAPLNRAIVRRRLVTFVDGSHPNLAEIQQRQQATLNSTAEA